VAIPFRRFEHCLHPVAVGELGEHPRKRVSTKPAKISAPVALKIGSGEAVTSHVNARFTVLPTPRAHPAAGASRLPPIQIQPKSSRGLEFKKLPPHPDIWSVRISDNYRAVGQREGDSIVWFFIGTHAEYDALLARL
jgi:hypothetical protein